MAKLIFRMKYNEAKWPVYLEDTFGKEIADQCVVESTQTASDHDARIHIMDFKANSKVIDTLKSNENVISAFLVNNKEAVETIK